MNSGQVLAEAYSRIPGIARKAVEGLDADSLRWQPEPGTNPIGWLVWHLARVQDDHVAEVAGDEQVWGSDGWPARFGLQTGTTETGNGHTIDQVTGLRPESAEALLGYLDAVSERTQRFLATLDDDALDRVVDASYDPPVTLGVRLVSVISDGIQHAGQARYLRGILDRSA